MNRVRSQLVSARTQLANQGAGLLLEYSIVLPQHIASADATPSGGPCSCSVARGRRVKSWRHLGLKVLKCRDQLIAKKQRDLAAFSEREQMGTPPTHSAVSGIGRFAYITRGLIGDPLATP